MKKNIILFLAISVFSVFAAASHKWIATCDSYKLVQDIDTIYFAGIAHTENFYVLVDPAGDLFRMAFSKNSEGASLVAQVGIDTNARIDASWGKFELTIVDSSALNEKISIQCKAK